MSIGLDDFDKWPDQRCADKARLTEIVPEAWSPPADGPPPWIERPRFDRVAPGEDSYVGVVTTRKPGMVYTQPLAGTPEVGRMPSYRVVVTEGMFVWPVYRRTDLGDARWLCEWLSTDGDVVCSHLRTQDGRLVSQVENRGGIR